MIRVCLVDDQTLVRQGGARRIHCLRTQLAVLLAPPQRDDRLESGDDPPDESASGE